MLPFLSGCRSLIFEDGNIFEAGVALQILDSQRIRLQDALDFFV